MVSPSASIVFHFISFFFPLFTSFRLIFSLHFFAASFSVPFVSARFEGKRAKRDKRGGSRGTTELYERLSLSAPAEDKIN